MFHRSYKASFIALAYRYTQYYYYTIGIFSLMVQTEKLGKFREEQF
jgi:hypothetical protein